MRPQNSKPDGTWPDNFQFITIPYSRLWTQIGLAKQFSWEKAARQTLEVFSKVLQDK